MTRLVGIDRLTTDDDDADPDVALHRHRADCTPQRLNAVVARTSCQAVETLFPIVAVSALGRGLGDLTAGGWSI